jgi:lipopolysaccharide export LptBFGC system permease protein LptF
MAKIKTLTKEELDKKRLKGAILSPICMYLVAVVISMLAFPTGLSSDRLGFAITLAIVGGFFLFGSLYALTKDREHIRIRIYFIIIGSVGFAPLITWFSHN